MIISNGTTTTTNNNNNNDNSDSNSNANTLVLGGEQEHVAVDLDGLHDSFAVALS